VLWVANYFGNTCFSSVTWCADHCIIVFHFLCANRLPDSKARGWGHSQNKGTMTRLWKLCLAPQSGHALHLWVLPIIKHTRWKLSSTKIYVYGAGAGEGGIFSLLLKSEGDLTLAVGVRSRLLPLFQRDIHDYNVASRV